MVFPHLSVKAGTPCPHVPGDLALAAADPGEALGQWLGFVGKI